MSSDPSDKSPPLPFDVFRSDGAARLPGQRFAKTEPVDPNRRSGPVEQRAIYDATGGPVQSAPERGITVLGSHDEPAPPTETSGRDPMTIRLETYSVDLAARIARVKAEQKEALDNLQQLAGDSHDPQAD